jgi:osmoprotectant transport system ATP-binding protein
VDELLELVGLPAKEFADRWPDELSGGQRQRVGVARALAVDPPVLLMDEPFGALDPLTRAELHAEFRRIQSRLRKTVIIVTHDMGEAFALADRVGVIEDGTLIANDRAAEVASSTDPRVRRLLDAVPVIPRV